MYECLIASGFLFVVILILRMTNRLMKTIIEFSKMDNELFNILHKRMSALEERPRWCDADESHQAHCGAEDCWWPKPGELYE